MKTKLFWNWKAALVLAGLPLVMASLSPSPEGGGETLLLESSQPAVANPATGVTNPPAEGELIATTNLLKPSEPTLPNMKFPTPVAEVAKLAQAGVSEGVILAYISNSATLFRANADQIVYLNDLGVSGAVISAMVEHDAALAAASGANLPATQAATEQTVAGYPTEATTSVPVSMPEYSTYDSGAYSTVDDAAFFYDSLSPYGSWVSISGYGLCWQPTVYVRNRDWRPYGDRGRWLYTDYGWYWQSDYSWGWATFHYGRWFCDVNRGWVWRPNRVWGPAWVSWRNSAEYCGWAPLPPAAHYAHGIGFTFGNRPVNASFDFGISASLYTFIPVERVCDYTPSRYCLSGPHSTRVYNESTVINHFTSRNRRVFNHGIDPGRVEAASRTPVRRAVVQETPHRDDNSRVRAERLERRGNSLVISGPELPVPAVRRRAAASSDTRGLTGRRSNDSREPVAARGRGNRLVSDTILTPPSSVAPPAPVNQAATGERRPRVQTISRRGVTPPVATSPIVTPPAATSPVATPPVATPAPAPVATQVPPTRGSRGATAPEANTEMRSIRSMIQDVKRNAGQAPSPAQAATPPPATPLASQPSPSTGSSTVQLPPRGSRPTEPAQVNTALPTSQSPAPARSFSFTVNRGFTPTPQPQTTYQPPVSSAAPVTQPGQESARPRIGGNRGFGSQASRNESAFQAPAQSQPQTLVPSRGNGGSSVGNFSRPNSAPTQPTAVPQTPRSESLRLPSRQSQSAPEMSAPSRPSVAPSFTPAPARNFDVPAPSRQQQSAPVLTPSRPSPAPAPAPAVAPSRPAPSVPSSSSSESSGRSGRR